MTKKTAGFICLNCQTRLNRWSGRCPNCGEWNTVVEQQAGTESVVDSEARPAETISIKNLPQEKLERIRTKSVEFDRVLGGSDPGIVVGSVILLAGSPGIGKSTLLLQTAASVPNALYFSAEESLEQIRLRATRLRLSKSELEISAERRLPSILRAIQEKAPSFVVIDSIQTVFDDNLPGTPGSIVQVRENCWRIQQFAKQSGVAVLLVGHITKEGVVAGPKILEHLVDVVMYLEGERQTGLRILRCEKNRFGSIDEVGIWQMTGEGFRAVEDPGTLFASLVTEDVPGRALTITTEGSRSFLVEIQALAAKTNFGYPKRAAQGIDLGRLNIILAVLENRLGISTSQFDIYVNVVGGFNLKDPGIDLAVAAAVASSITKAILPDKEVLIGELGLLGEIRPVIDKARRSKEADRVGYHINQNIKTIQDLARLLQSPK